MRLEKFNSPSVPGQTQLQTVCVALHLPEKVSVCVDIHVNVDCFDMLESVIHLLVTGSYLRLYNRSSNYIARGKAY